jgi:hypothetical protein
VIRWFLFLELDCDVCESKAFVFFCPSRFCGSDLAPFQVRFEVGQSLARHLKMLQNRPIRSRRLLFQVDNRQWKN